MFLFSFFKTTLYFVLGCGHPLEHGLPGTTLSKKTGFPTLQVLTLQNALELEAQESLPLHAGMLPGLCGPSGHHSYCEFMRAAFCHVQKTLF